MNLNIETEKHETHYDVAVAGELDVATVPELEKCSFLYVKQGRTIFMLI